MPTLMEKTRAEWSRLFQKQQPDATPVNSVDPTNTELDSATFQAMIRNFSSYFTNNNDRFKKLELFDEMDEEDIAVQLDATVDAALMFEDRESSDDPLLVPETFKVVFPSNYNTSRARKIIEQVIKDTRVRREVPVLARDMLKYGDAFMEIIPDANDDRIVRRVLHKDIHTMRVNRDNKGRLRKDVDRDGNPMAYQEVDSAGRVVAGWYPNEMVHFKLYPDSMLTYSQKGLLDDIRSSWRKLNWIEQGVVIARVVRAYPRLVHYLDTSGKTSTEATSTIKNYIAAITKKNVGVGTDKKVPMAVDEDFFVGSGYLTSPDNKMVPKLNKIDLLDPNASGLGQVGDIQQMRRKVFSRVPGEVVGIMDQAAQELSSQDIAYGRLVLRVQQRLEDGLRELIDHALFLQGMEGIRYRIVWPTVVIGTSWKFADAKFRVSMARRNDLEMGVTSREAIMREMGMSEEEIEQVKQEWMDMMKQEQQMQVDMAKNMAKIVPAAQKNNPNPDTTSGTPGKAKKAPGSQGGTPGAGNKNKRGPTVTIKTTGGQGQAAQGAKGG